MLTTIIKYGTKSATGFFFSEKEQLYLVTAKHVIYGSDYTQKDATPKIHFFTLTLHVNRQDFRMNEDVTIKLFDGSGQRIWLEHSEPQIDVVLIPISLDENKFIISKMNKSFIEENDELLVQFEKILIVGYPFGWYDDKFNFPIVRVGHLSSPFKIPFKGEPAMLGDAITHSGMSGSPVMMLFRDPITRDKKGNLIPQQGYKYLLAFIHRSLRYTENLENI